MSEIVWEEPPEDALHGARRAPYIEFVVALKAHPQKWARVPGERTESSAKAFAQNVRRAKVRGFEPVGAFDSATKDGVVWARYLGEPKAQLPEIVGDLTPDGDSMEVVKLTTIGKQARAWAQENGFDVPERGRLPESVLKAFFKAHPEIPDPRPRSV